MTKKFLSLKLIVDKIFFCSDIYILVLLLVIYF